MDFSCQVSQNIIYDAQADIIGVNDIASGINNQFVLRCLKRNNADDTNNHILYIRQFHDVLYHDGDDEENCDDYHPEGSFDMGWLGYFVGKNDHLKKLVIMPFTPTSGESVRGVLEPFFRGISCNKSIREIHFSSMDILGGEAFTMITPFFKNKYNLTSITINGCDFGDDGTRLFALALGSCKNESLKELTLYNNNISEEGMVDIITSLSMFSHLQRLHLTGNRLHKNGCVALAILLHISAKELQYLNLLNNEINDDGIEALVPALANCSRLESLHLSNNPSITTRGWQHLASILEAPNSNLTGLDVDEGNIDDQAAAAFANALVNNPTLHTLYLTSNTSITNIGWQAFSKLLCDPTSVNATFLSNHTLRFLGYEIYENEIIGPLLRLNVRNNKKEVAMIKILQNHEDFNMQPFFEWEFKVFPLVISWLERASACAMPRGFEPNIERRKLSTVYQFVRGMPVLYVETRLRKELEDIKALIQRLAFGN